MAFPCSFVTTTFVVEAMAAANAQLRWKRMENHQVCVCRPGVRAVPPASGVPKTRPSAASSFPLDARRARVHSAAPGPCPKAEASRPPRLAGHVLPLLSQCCTWSLPLPTCGHVVPPAPHLQLARPLGTSVPRSWTAASDPTSECVRTSNVTVWRCCDLPNQTPARENRNRGGRLSIGPRVLL